MNVRARTLTAATALFAATAAFVLAKTGRDALFFMGGGLPDLPGAYLAVAALSVPTSLGLVFVTRRAGTRRTRVGLTLGTAALLLLFARWAQPGGGPAMTAVFVLIALLFGGVFSSTWLLAADLLERAPEAARTRAYGLGGTASIAGGGTGALVARAAAMHVAPQALLAAAAGALALAAGIMATAHARCTAETVPDEAMPEAGDAGRGLARGYERHLLAIGMLAALAGTLVEFRFYLAAATSGHSMREGAHFFASSYFALNGSALALQVALLTRGERVGARRGLFALPLCLLGGGAAMLLLRSPALPTVLRIAEGSLKSSIHRVSWEQAYLPLARARRALAKLYVEGLGTHLAEGAGALLMLAWLRNGAGAAWGDWLLLGVTLLWLALTVRLRPPAPSGS